MRLTALLLFSIFSFAACKEKAKQPIPPPAMVKAKSVNADTILFVTMQFNEMSLLPAIRQKVTSFYHRQTKSISNLLPSTAYYKPRNRYKAGVIIDYLSTFNSENYRFVAGLTSKDISAQKGTADDWGIFGLGSLSNKGCIISTYRLGKNVSQRLLLERLEKVVLHELGHNHGLTHCTSPLPCFMKDGEGSIRTVDEEPMDMCEVCRKKINLK